MGWSWDTDSVLWAFMSYKDGELHGVDLDGIVAASLDGCGTKLEAGCR